MGSHTGCFGKIEQLEAEIDRHAREVYTARLSALGWAATAEAWRGLVEKFVDAAGREPDGVLGGHRRVRVAAEIINAARAALAPAPCATCGGSRRRSAQTDVDAPCPACSGTGEAQAPDVREWLDAAMEAAAKEGYDAGIHEHVNVSPSRLYKLVDAALASLPSPPAGALREHDEALVRRALEAATAHADRCGGPAWRATGGYYCACGHAWGVVAGPPLAGPAPGDHAAPEYDEADVTPPDAAAAEAVEAEATVHYSGKEGW